VTTGGGAGREVETARRVGLVLGPAVSLLFLAFVELDPGAPAVTATATVALWMAIWWMSEAVPLAITALLPIVLFPLLGVMDGRDVPPLYLNHIVFLFLGGFVVALAMERWGLHERVALAILTTVGTSPARLLAGVMLAAAILSMWISNTATAMTMVPIVGAVLSEVDRHESEAQARRVGVGLLLGLAYGASVGGIATLVGTPPNPMLVQIYAIHFPEAPEIGFARFMAFALPLSIVFLVVVWAYLRWIFLRGSPGANVDPTGLRRRRAALGPMSAEERIVLADFLLLAASWMTRVDLELGAVTIPGWSSLVPHGGWIDDGTVAIAFALPLFALPAPSRPGARVMDWATARRLPWDIVLLFGGGFALAHGFTASGLSTWLGERLAGAGALPTPAIVAAVAGLATFLTELTSNTATAQMLLPILAGLAESLRIHPLLLMAPGALACSLAFMLPVATPPNAIVFGTGRVRISEMVRTGLVLNLLGMIFLTVTTLTLGRLVLGIDLAAPPEWIAFR
jgi:sodium-dependent dicarboxylate transporter 2/3/5